MSPKNVQKKGGANLFLTLIFIYLFIKNSIIFKIYSLDSNNNLKKNYNYIINVTLTPLLKPSLSHLPNFKNFNT